MNEICIICKTPFNGERCANGHPRFDKECLKTHFQKMDDFDMGEGKTVWLNEEYVISTDDIRNEIVVIIDRKLQKPIYTSEAYQRGLKAIKVLSQQTPTNN